MYHAFASVLNLQLVRANSGTPATSRQRMLFHKGEAIRLLNDKISHLETEDIEAVLVGMLTVYPDEEEVVKASMHTPNLFVSHMPWANNSTIYAGVDPQSLCRAIEWLVKRAGGLLNLKIQAMPKATSKYGSSVYSDSLSALC